MIDDSEDINDDLRDLDPDDLNSIVRWSRARQFQPRWREEEPAPKPEPKSQQKLTDAEEVARAAKVSWDWECWVKNYVADYVGEVVKIIANESGEHTRAEIKKSLQQALQPLRESIIRLQSDQRKVTIYAPQLDLEDALQKHVGPLRTEFEALRKEFFDQRRGEIIDLPALPTRKRA